MGVQATYQIERADVLHGICTNDYRENVHVGGLLQ